MQSGLDITAGQSGVSTAVIDTAVSPADGDPV